MRNAVAGGVVDGEWPIVNQSRFRVFVILFLPGRPVSSRKHEKRKHEMDDRAHEPFSGGVAPLECRRIARIPPGWIRCDPAGVEDWIRTAFRRYRCAQPPANCLYPSGMGMRASARPIACIAPGWECAHVPGQSLVSLRDATVGTSPYMTVPGSSFELSVPFVVTSLLALKYRTRTGFGRRDSRSGAGPLRAMRKSSARTDAGGVLG